MLRLLNREDMEKLFGHMPPSESKDQVIKEVLEKYPYCRTGDDGSLLTYSEKFAREKGLL